MVKVNYTYKATVVSVYDGDTMRVNIDMGFGILNKGETGKGVSLRLFGINAPEVRGESKETGKFVRDFVRNKVLGKDIVIETIRDTKGKYGRYLAKIYYKNSENEQVYLNEELVNNNFAIWKKY